MKRLNCESPNCDTKKREKTPNTKILLFPVTDYSNGSNKKIGKNIILLKKIPSRRENICFSPDGTFQSQR